MLISIHLSSTFPQQHDSYESDDLQLGNIWNEADFLDNEAQTSNFKKTSDLMNPFKTFLEQHTSRNFGTDDLTHPRKRNEASFKSKVPVRRNNREIGLSSGLETVEPGSGGISLQDLEQIRRAIRAWDAKLMKFAEKFANHQETLKSNPVWNKLVKIRNSLVQLAAAEEMRQGGLDETRM